MAAKESKPIRFAAATAERWGDVEALFGANGACAGCWCMYYRQRSSEFHARKGAANRDALRALVRSGREPGILAYAGDEPIGWCAVAPRAEYVRLERSRNLAPIDALPVWSVPCLFVTRAWRRRGLTSRLLEAAASHARTRGGTILEGYPLVPAKRDVPAAFAWNGFLSSFLRAGFVEAIRRSPRQAIVRRRLRARRPGR